MTVPIKKSDTKTALVVKGYSRYKDSPVIYWGDQNRMAFETYVRQPYTKTGKEKVALITPGLAYRPDLLAYKYYGFPDPWWKIMEVNGMHDVLDFKPGVTVILPDELL